MLCSLLQLGRLLHGVTATFLQVRFDSTICGTLSIARLVQSGHRNFVSRQANSTH